MIFAFLPATLLLMGTSLAFSGIAGALLGVISAKPHGTMMARLMELATGLSLAAYSLPAFWVGMLLLLILGLNLRLFPTFGIVRPGVAGINWMFDILHHLTLPTLTLSLSHLAMYFRLTRASMVESLSKEYITTAKAKGLDENTVFYKHALRNSILPLVTMIGMQLSTMVGGTVTIEAIFSWPGLGKLTFDAIQARDYPVVLGTFIFLSASVIVTTILIDALYVKLNPRIRYR